ncbi:MAG: hypothetical protein KF691_02925 [Phycisphaeraceae bacterium]|nr:hypothetical protein [Phycisphaeraceae bacterium]
MHGLEAGLAAEDVGDFAEREFVDCGDPVDVGAADEKLVKDLREHGMDGVHGWTPTFAVCARHL